MKPFDLELAKQGHPVCTRDGRNARIICFDFKNVHPIVSCVESLTGESIQYNNINGNFIMGGSEQCDKDLMMKSTKEKRWMCILDEEIANGRILISSRNIHTSRPKEKFPYVECQIIEFEVEI